MVVHRTANHMLYRPPLTDTISNLQLMILIFQEPHREIQCSRYDKFNRCLSAELVVVMTYDPEVAAELSQPCNAADITCRKIPSKLLDLSNPSAGTKAIFARNKRESPLLALPGEIRSKIWEEVMGGHSIHILPGVGRSYQIRICLSPEDYPAPEVPRVVIVPYDKSANDGTENGCCFTIRHRKCSTDDTAMHARHGMNLDTLRTCRQFYQEAVLLPFQLNNFTLGLRAPTEGQPPAVDRFLDRLCRDQREAIRHITFVSKSICSGDKVQLARLRGLRYLDFVLATGSSPNDLYHLISQLWMDSARCQLSLPLLETVRVNLESYVGKRDYKALQPQAFKLEGLVRNIEARMLYSHTGDARLQAALEKTAVLRCIRDSADMSRRLCKLEHVFSARRRSSC